MNISSTPVRSNLANVLLQMKGQDSSVDQSQGPIAIEPVNKLSSESEPVGCNCRKSKCLKLYCACFAAKAVCQPTCNCVGCANTVNNVTERQEAMKLILDRNPSAFDSKFKTEATLVHKTGCRCRKSQCLKKYCECFHAGVICNAICTCLQCANDGTGRVVLNNSKNKVSTPVESENEYLLPMRSPPDTEESIRKAAEALLRARDENQPNASYTLDYSIGDDMQIIRAESSSGDYHLQKRKREINEEDTTQSGSIVQRLTGNEYSHSKGKTYPSRSPLHERPTILARSNPRQSDRSKIIASRLASPNSLICASALSLLSRRDTSPRALSGIDPFGTQISPVACGIKSTPISSPTGVAAPLPSPIMTTYQNQSVSSSMDLMSEEDYNDSPYKCKSAIHLVPDSFSVDPNGYPSYLGPMQLSLPYCLVSHDEANWIHPVVDVKGFISKSNQN